MYIIQRCCETAWRRIYIESWCVSVWRRYSTQLILVDEVRNTVSHTESVEQLTVHFYFILFGAHVLWIFFLVSVQCEISSLNFNKCEKRILFIKSIIIWFKLLELTSTSHFIIVASIEIYDLGMFSVLITKFMEKNEANRRYTDWLSGRNDRNRVFNLNKSKYYWIIRPFKSCVFVLFGSSRVFLCCFCWFFCKQGAHPIFFIKKSQFIIKKLQCVRLFGFSWLETHSGPFFWWKTTFFGRLLVNFSSIFK